MPVLDSFCSILKNRLRHSMYLKKLFPMYSYLFVKLYAEYYRKIGNAFAVFFILVVQMFSKQILIHMMTTALALKCMGLVRSKVKFEIVDTINI